MMFDDGSCPRSLAGSAVRAGGCGLLSRRRGVGEHQTKQKLYQKTAPWTTPAPPAPHEQDPKLIVPF